MQEISPPKVEIMWRFPGAAHFGRGSSPHLPETARDRRTIAQIEMPATDLPAPKMATETERKVMLSEMSPMEDISGIVPTWTGLRPNSRVIRPITATVVDTTAILGPSGKSWANRALASIHSPLVIEDTVTVPITSGTIVILPAVTMAVGIRITMIVLTDHPTGGLALTKITNLCGMAGRREVATKTRGDIAPMHSPATTMTGTPRPATQVTTMAGGMIGGTNFPRMNGEMTEGGADGAVTPAIAGKGIPGATRITRPIVEATTGRGVVLLVSRKNMTTTNTVGAPIGLKRTTMVDTTSRRGKSIDPIGPEIALAIGLETGTNATANHRALSTNVAVRAKGVTMITKAVVHIVKKVRLSFQGRRTQMPKQILAWTTGTIAETIRTTILRRHLLVLKHQCTMASFIHLRQYAR